MLRSRLVALASSATLGGALLLVPQVLPASAAPSAGADTSDLVVPAARPPAGKAWVTGVITDQAGHTLNDVLVEALPVDGGEPVASSLTYESIRKDGQNGFFNLEVPTDASYLVVVSADPDDEFRTYTFNDGEPIVVKHNRERELGTAEIARVAKQRSVTTAKLSPAKVKVGKKAKVKVTVACDNVDPVLGKVTAAIGKQKVSGTLKESSRGRITLTLPKLRKPGTYTVKVSFVGNSFVKGSGDAVALKVKK